MGGNYQLILLPNSEVIIHCCTSKQSHIDMKINTGHTV